MIKVIMLLLAYTCVARPPFARVAKGSSSGGWSGYARLYMCVSMYVKHIPEL